MLRFLSGRSRRKNNINAPSSQKKNQIDCRIILLDGTDLSYNLTVSIYLAINHFTTIDINSTIFLYLYSTFFSINFCCYQKKALGNDLYEQVFYSLDLIEKDYFGLQFTDANHVKHWLDPTKPIKKQVKSNEPIENVVVSVWIDFVTNSILFPVGPPYTLRLKVKFYSSEPNTLREELTRYQFFLQLKQDLLEGKLECTDHRAIEMCALALQCKFISFSFSIGIFFFFIKL